MKTKQICIGVVVVAVLLIFYNQIPAQNSLIKTVSVVDHSLLRTICERSLVVVLTCGAQRDVFHSEYFILPKSDTSSCEHLDINYKGNRWKIKGYRPDHGNFMEFSSQQHLLNCTDAYEVCYRDHFKLPWSVVSLIPSNWLALPTIVLFCITFLTFGKFDLGVESKFNALASLAFTYVVVFFDPIVPEKLLFLVLVFVLGMIFLKKQRSVLPLIVFISCLLFLNKEVINFLIWCWSGVVFALVWILIPYLAILFIDLSFDSRHTHVTSLGVGVVLGLLEYYGFYYLSMFLAILIIMFICFFRDPPQTLEIPSLNSGNSFSEVATSVFPFSRSVGMGSRNIFSTERSHIPTNQGSFFNRSGGLPFMPNNTSQRNSTRNTGNNSIPTTTNQTTTRITPAKREHGEEPNDNAKYYRRSDD